MADQDLCPQCAAPLKVAPESAIDKTLRAAAPNFASSLLTLTSFASMLLALLCSPQASGLKSSRGLVMSVGLLDLILLVLYAMVWDWIQDHAEDEAYGSEVMASRPSLEVFQERARRMNKTYFGFVFYVCFASAAVLGVFLNQAGFHPYWLWLLPVIMWTWLFLKMTTNTLKGSIYFMWFFGAGLIVTFAYQFARHADLEHVLMAIVAFAATNIDDFVILILLFSLATTAVNRSKIWGGQFLGIAALVLLSLLLMMGCRSLCPVRFIPWLGAAPFLYGVTCAVKRLWREPHADDSSDGKDLKVSLLAVASLTIANGFDNVSLYTPLFVGSTKAVLLVTVAVFLVLTALWCLVASCIASIDAVRSFAEKHNAWVFPTVMMALGLYIMGPVLRPFLLAAP